MIKFNRKRAVIGALFALVLAIINNSPLFGDMIIIPVIGSIFLLAYFSPLLILKIIGISTSAFSHDFFQPSIGGNIFIIFFYTLLFGYIPFRSDISNEESKTKKSDK